MKLTFGVQSGHAAVIAKLDWAHPEFGQLLASCSADRTAKIWAEEHGEAGTSFKEKITLTDSREELKDIQFAPHHLGLKVVCLPFVLCLLCNSFA